MKGLMQQFPLTVDMTMRRGATFYPAQRVVTRTCTGLRRTDFGAVAADARRIATVLDELGIGADARVGSFGWNTDRHLALYFAVPCTGRVLHTVNIRQTADQIAYSINHAEDEALFVDRSLLPSLSALEVRGPWIAREYYRQPADEGGGQNGWLRTGDIAAISPLGYIRIVDRAKDLIKSGGEWKSSVDFENHILAHPAAAEAAVIAVPHPRRMERPLACVALKPGARVSPAEFIDFLRERVEKWQLPDEVVIVAEIPKTSVGKLDKKTLRVMYQNHQLLTERP